MNENETPVVEETTKEPTFDELLKNPEYQREFDKKLEGARQKWETKWQEKANAERNEAERLAKMSESERFQEEISKLKEQNEHLVKEKNASNLKEEAIKLANEKGLDLTLLNLFDYGTETAETIKDKIDSLQDSVNKAVQKSVEERLRQPSPKQVYENPVTGEKSYLDIKYKNNPYYKG